MSIYQLLLTTLPEFRIVILNIEEMDGVSFNNQTSIKVMNSGCFLCPRENEVGDIHLCIDGSFNLPRRANAGKAFKQHRLDGLIRERLLFDSFSTEAESRSCNTVALRARIEAEKDLVCQLCYLIYLVVSTMFNIQSNNRSK